MAFKAVNTTLTTNETILYTAPVGVDGVVFSGIISNTSDAQETVTVTLRITNNSVVTYILSEVPIIHGGSLTIPKVVVKPGASLSGIAVGSESNNAVDITISILERATTTVIGGQDYPVPPVDHAAEDTTYGPATNTSYGHVKGDGTTINITNGVASLNAYYLGIDDVFYSRPSLFTTNKTSVIIPAYTTFRINGELYSTTQPVTLNTNTIKEAGKDAYVYATLNSGVLGFTLSKNSTVPDGFNAENSRKLGGFHMLCANVGTIAGHPLTGYVAGDILPASCWDLKHRPVSEPEGMVYDSGLGIWVDIYLASWSGSKLVSAYGGTTADGTSTKNFHGELFVEELGNVGKRLPWRNEFMHFAKGSNECTNINGNADPVTTGGHTDSANRRMISNIGCEDCCGALWQWTSDIVEGGAYGTISTNTTSQFLAGYTWSNSMIDPDAEDPLTVADPVWNSNIDGETHYGNSYGLPRRLLVGYHWDNSSRCGSRSVNCACFPARRSSSSGGRGVSSPRPQGL